MLREPVSFDDLAEGELPGASHRLHTRPQLRAVPHQPADVSPWMDNFRALSDYARRSGHSRPPYRELIDGRNLYAWAAKQRSRRSKLSDTQCRLLESVPGWSWNVRQLDWERNFHTLRAFVAREGHCRVPRAHVEGGIGLGRWVAAQRQRLHTMDPARRHLLESLPGWTSQARADRWWEARASLARFAAEHGHAEVPYETTFEGRRLGMWVARQRVSFRNGTLTQPRIESLEAVRGWTWNPSDRPLDRVEAS